MYAENLTSLRQNNDVVGYPDDPEALPAGSVIEGSEVRADLTDEADYVVIGSGAAGASAAVVLAEHGYSVIFVEEGPWVRTRQMSPDLFPALKYMFRNMGTGVTMGKSALLVMQGRCVGGSTTVNSAIAWRPPEHVLEDWSTRFGTGDSLSMAALAPHFDEIERVLNVHPVDEDALGRNNGLFQEGATRIGIRSSRIQRYESGCEGSGGCLTGCVHGRKLGMNITHIPQVLHAGGRIYTHAKVDRVESKNGRAVAVRARLDAPGRPVLRVRARRGVIVAASAVQTPGVLRRSGLRARDLGRHFQAHPGVSIIGRFDRPVHMEFGATQGFNSTHFVKTDRFKLETVAIPPELAALRMPGYGRDLVGRLAEYEHLACWAVVLRAETEGRVVSPFGIDQVLYSLQPADMVRVRKGLKVLSQMMFAAGAREIWPSAYGMPTVMTPDQVDLWDDGPLDPTSYNMMVSHLFGSARLGPDPRTSVVGLDFQAHEMSGLYVVDSSVFPSNIGVNPQHTIMAVARHAATRIADAPLPRTSR